MVLEHVDQHRKIASPIEGENVIIGFLELDIEFILIVTYRILTHFSILCILLAYL